MRLELATGRYELFYEGGYKKTFDPIWSHLAPFDPIWSGLVPFNPVTYCMIQHCHIRNQKEILSAPVNFR